MYSVPEPNLLHTTDGCTAKLLSFRAGTANLWRVLRISGSTLASPPFFGTWAVLYSVTRSLSSWPIIDAGKEEARVVGCISSTGISSIEPVANTIDWWLQHLPSGAISADVSTVNVSSVIVQHGVMVGSWSQSAQWYLHMHASSQFKKSEDYDSWLWQCHQEQSTTAHTWHAFLLFWSTETNLHAGWWLTCSTD
jgi:hypothetical protein